jgi:hypothetical protein
LTSRNLENEWIAATATTFCCGIDNVGHGNTSGYAVTAFHLIEGVFVTHLSKYPIEQIPERLLVSMDNKRPSVESLEEHAYVSAIPSEDEITKISEATSSIRQVSIDNFERGLEVGTSLLLLRLAGTEQRGTRRSRCHCGICSSRNTYGTGCCMLGHPPDACSRGGSRQKELFHSARKQGKFLNECFVLVSRFTKFP